MHPNLGLRIYVQSCNLPALCTQRYAWSTSSGMSIHAAVARCAAGENYPEFEPAFSNSFLPSERRDGRRILWMQSVLHSHRAPEASCEEKASSSPTCSSRAETAICRRRLQHPQEGLNLRRKGDLTTLLVFVAVGRRAPRKKIPGLFPAPQLPASSDTCW